MHNKSFFATFAVAFLSLLAIANAATISPTAQDIVRTSDEIRNPNPHFVLLNTMTEYHKGVATQQLSLRVHSKIDPATGQFRNLVKFLAPAKDAGKALLMNGNIMWFFTPSSGASIRISPQQRLLGQASNGDVLSVNFSKDYNAEIQAEEMIEDSSHKSRHCWHLNLLSAAPAAVYSRIEYWIETGTYYPVKARFYAASGRILKIAFYEGYDKRKSGTGLVQAIILDEVDSSLVTRMIFSDFQPAEIPEAWFQREYLPHLPRQ